MPFRDHLRSLTSTIRGAGSALRGSGPIRNPFRGLPDQFLRLLVVFAIFFGAVLFVRVFLIPPSLKETGFHRSSTIEREAGRPVRFAGAQACTECHDGEHSVLKASYHGNLSCETCHGAAMEHVEDPFSSKPDAPRERSFCPLCHAYNASRPTGFPQINATIHNPLKPCITCHNPHDPAPSELPHGCNACHAEIARTKSVSPHALLDCVVCHSNGKEHLTSPRAATPGIPKDRAFCGTCHGEGSPRVDAPKVDLRTHGEKYLCWQCHYPHLPELRR